MIVHGHLIRFEVPKTKLADINRNKVLEAIDTALELGGVGISAPQIGVNQRWSLVFPEGDRCRLPHLLINPEIREYGGDAIDSFESCLSLDTRHVVRRFEHVKLFYTGYNGVQVEKWFDGFTSVIIQHEVDHLNGVLIDRKACQ